MANESAQLLSVLEAFTPLSDEEVDAVQRIQRLASSTDPFARASPLHATGSAVIVHPPTRRVLLRWHERMQAWLQVGGHADAGESDPYAIALREAEEETGLCDLVAWPCAERHAPVQIVIVPVPPGKGEPPHQHADLRYVLATQAPDTASPETPSAPLEWLDLDIAVSSITEDNLRRCLERVAALFRSS